MAMNLQIGRRQNEISVYSFFRVSPWLELGHDTSAPGRTDHRGYVKMLLRTASFRCGLSSAMISTRRNRIHLPEMEVIPRKTVWWGNKK